MKFIYLTLHVDLLSSNHENSRDEFESHVNKYGNPIASFNVGSYKVCFIFKVL